MRNLAFGFAVGVGVGAGGAFLYVQRLRPQPGQQASPPLHPPAAPAAPGGKMPDIWKPAPEAHPALKFGAPVTEAVRLFSGFVSCFDLRTRNPRWVLEVINKDSLQGDGDRKNSDFFEDAALEERFRAKLSDYRGSGYDRGHMAPAANHKASQKAIDDTFSLNNISPQVGKGFNRDYWARFERFVKDVAQRADSVYIVTGPLWLPRPDDAAGGDKWVMQHPLIGQPPSLVSVPTHYYKVVLADASSGKHGPKQVAVGAFVMPNAPIDPGYPLSAFVVPLEALEPVAGAKFFQSYLTDDRRRATDETAVAWRQQGLAAMRTFDRQSLLTEQAPLALPASSSATAPAAAPVPAGRKTTAAAAAGTAAEAASSAAAQPLVPPPLPPPRTVGGRGAVHLCEHSACVLPAENFWQATDGNGKPVPHRPRGKGRD